MILSPWPMILRSLPITERGPPSGAGGRGRCGGWALRTAAPSLAGLAPGAGGGVLGSVGELRVNMKNPRWALNVP
jgi:hypothetical protein